MAGATLEKVGHSGALPAHPRSPLVWVPRAPASCQAPCQVLTKQGHSSRPFPRQQLWRDGSGYLCPGAQGHGALPWRLLWEPPGHPGYGAVDLPS